MPELSPNDAEIGRFTGDQSRSQYAGYWHVAAWLLMSLFVLAVLFLVQLQFVARSDSDRGSTESSADASNALIGRSFTNREEFLADQQNRDYLFVGRFDEDWPAKVVGVDTARDRISICRADGTLHHYNGYEGYWLKVVRFNSQRGGEAIIVLRSRKTD